MRLADIDDVQRGTVNFGDPTTDGASIADLFELGPTEDRTFRDETEVVQGTITQQDLAPTEDGSFTGGMAEFQQLLDNGEAHVRVTTDAFPAGEVGGQVGEATPPTYARDVEVELNGDAHGITTDATGRAHFTINDTGDEIDYEVWVSDIEGVTGGDVHLGADGQTGRVAAHLFTLDDVDERNFVDETLVGEGRILADEVIQDPQDPEWGI